MYPCHLSSSSDDLPLSLEGEEHTKEVQFLRSQNCCVCFVDIVDSTKVTSSINNPEKIRKYYEIFLNTMAYLKLRISQNISTITIRICRTPYKGYHLQRSLYSPPLAMIMDSISRDNKIFFVTCYFLGPKRKLPWQLQRFPK